MDDPLIDEARRAGQAYIDSFKGNRKAMRADLRRRSKQAGHETVRLQPKRPRVRAIAEEN